MEDRFSGRGWQALVLALAAALLLTRLGALGLWAADEPRYAQVAEEMRALAHGPASLVLLSLNGQPYDQKPPLYFALAALAGAPGGRVTEAAARLPSALAGVALVALLLGWGSRLLGRSAATFGAGFLLTSALFAYLARRAQLDVLLALFESLALLGFWRLDREIGSRRANLVLLHGAMGLGVLTKGPVGLLVPALVIAVYLAWERRLPALRQAFPLRGFALSLLPALLWILLATVLAPAGFFEGAVVENLYGRFFLGTSKAHSWYFLLGAFPADFLPWTVLWPLVYRVGRREVFAPEAAPEPRRAWRFLLAWVGATLVFFSLSTGKRDLYLLPCYPAMALLCGDAAVRGLRALPALSRWAVLTATGLAAAFAVAALLISIAPVIPNVDVPLAFAGAVLGVMAGAWALWRGATAAGLGALGQLAAAFCAVLGLELAIGTLLFPAIDPEKSPRPLALAAAALAPPGEAIGLVEQRPAVGGLAYYSGRRIDEIRRGEDLRRYFEDGGHVAVVRAETFERVHGDQFAEIRTRFRTGKRATLVVTPHDGLRATSPHAGAAPPTTADDPEDGEP